MNFTSIFTGLIVHGLTCSAIAPGAQSLRLGSLYTAYTSWSCAIAIWYTPYTVCIGTIYTTQYSIRPHRLNWACAIGLTAFDHLPSTGVYYLVTRSVCYGRFFLHQSARRPLGTVKTYISHGYILTIHTSR